MLAKDIDEYKDQVAKRNNKIDKRTLTDTELFENLIPIETNPNFQRCEDTVFSEEINDDENVKTVKLILLGAFAGITLFETFKSIYIKFKTRRKKEKHEN